jgi:hypothetical protein
MERTAKCLCGQFSVIVTGEPTRSTSAIAVTANDDQACLGPATPILQKNTFV